MDTNLEERVRKLGLDVPENWKGDIRGSLLLLFEPIVNGSEISLYKNETDKGSKLLDINKEGYKGRIGGIKTLTNMECWIFLNKDFFNVAQNKLGLPDNMQPNRSQPHIKVSLETVWKILCFLTGKGEV